MAQLNLFTDKTCAHCGENPGVSPRNPNLWNGFIDRDTDQHVCWKCKNIHYQEKAKTMNLKSGMIYSEQPVML